MTLGTVHLRSSSSKYDCDWNEAFESESDKEEFSLTVVDIFDEDDDDNEDDNEKHGRNSIAS